MAVETVSEIFETAIPGKLQAKPELVEKINSTYKFNVTGDGGGTWHVDLTQPGGKITNDDADAACMITVASEDLIQMVNGTINPQMAFMTGKLKIAGDMGLAMKLGSLIG